LLLDAARPAGQPRARRAARDALHGFFSSGAMRTLLIFIIIMSAAVGNLTIQTARERAPRASRSSPAEAADIMKSRSSPTDNPPVTAKFDRDQKSHQLSVDRRTQKAKTAPLTADLR
jgi:hypothetical protein